VRTESSASRSKYRVVYFVVLDRNVVTGLYINAVVIGMRHVIVDDHGVISALIVDSVAVSTCVADHVGVIGRTGPTLEMESVQVFGVNLPRASLEHGQISHDDVPVTAHPWSIEVD